MERLIAARENTGLAQCEFSKMMDRSPNFRNKCESGPRSVDVMEFTKMAQFYSKPVNHFFAT